jgi:hypothetical protein
MRTLFDQVRQREVLDRLAHLASDAQPLWGRMNVHQAVCHLSSQLAHTLGELPAEAVMGPMSRRPLNWILIHAAPWPKGSAQSPPEFLHFETRTWEEDRAELRELIHRFAERREEEAWPPSPVFGKLTRKDYGVLSYRHLDHHLTQFGA